MEGTMEQFTEKLAGLVELGKKNKNFLEYAQIDSYFKDMKAELKKVIWPTPKQLVNNTIAVVVIVLVTAAIVFVLDVVFDMGNKYGISKMQNIVNEKYNKEESSEDTDNTESSDNGEENTDNQENANTENSTADETTNEGENSTAEDSNTTESNTENVTPTEETTNDGEQTNQEQ